MASSGASADASAQTASVEELLVTGKLPRCPSISSAPFANAISFTELPKFDLDLYIQNYTGLSSDLQASRSFRFD